MAEKQREGDRTFMQPSEPELEDFVSEDPKDLPTFDPTIRHRAVAENVVDYKIYVDGVEGAGDAAVLIEVRTNILDIAARTCRDIARRTSGGNVTQSAEGVDDEPIAYLWHCEPFLLREPGVGRPMSEPTQVRNTTEANEDGLGPSSGGADLVRLYATLDEGAPPCLHGRFCFGDSLDDEWLAVWILTEATRVDPRLSVTIRDNDDEFLLIETSEAWPRSLDWLDPDCAHNRVFLRGGELHLLSARVGQEEDRGPLCLPAALGLLRGVGVSRDDSPFTLGSTVRLQGLVGRPELNGRFGMVLGWDQAEGRFVVSLCPPAHRNTDPATPSGEKVRLRPTNVVPVPADAASSQSSGKGPGATLAPGAVRRALKGKIDSVLAEIGRNQMWARVVLPASLAFMLYHRPELLSRAVRAFHTRTPDDAVVASACSRFGPKRTAGCAASRLDKSDLPIEVTVKTTRLVYAMVEQDEAFAAPPRLAAAWNHELALRDGVAPAEASFNRGSKLTAAFELLFASAKKRSMHPVHDRPTVVAPISAVPSGLDLLKVSDAELYKSLELFSVAAITASMDLPLSSQSMLLGSSAPSWLKRMTRNKPDDDSWLRVSPEDLEEMLRGQSSQKTETTPVAGNRFDDKAGQLDEAYTTEQGAARLGEIVDGVKRFLAHGGEAAAGAEFPANLHDGTGHTQNDASQGHEVSLDADLFLKLLKGGDGGPIEDVERADGEDLFNDSDRDSGSEDRGDEGTEDDAEEDERDEPEEEEDGAGADDDGDDNGEDFSTMYGARLEQEVGSSTVLGSSFERTPAFPDEGQGAHVGSDQPLPSNGGEEPETGSPSELDDDISPVDVDANLVKHLLESFVSQEGLAGPASNLLREMGVFFPAIPKTRCETSKAEEIIEGDASSLPVPYQNVFGGDIMYQLD